MPGRTRRRSHTDDAGCALAGYGGGASLFAVVAVAELEFAAAFPPPARERPLRRGSRRRH